MPEITIRHIDRLMADRIQSLAKERQWSTHDVILQALRRGLGFAVDNSPLAENLRESTELCAQYGELDDSEQAVFREAMQALSKAPAEQMAPAKLGSA